MKPDIKNYGRGLGLLLLRELSMPPMLPGPRFTDVTDAAGIQVQQTWGDVEMTNIVEATGPGCCIFDYDNDGYMASTS